MYVVELISPFIYFAIRMLEFSLVSSFFLELSFYQSAIPKVLGVTVKIDR
jgi:hypothetical protein